MNFCSKICARGVYLTSVPVKDIIIKVNLKRKGVEYERQIADDTKK